LALSGPEEMGHTTTKVALSNQATSFRHQSWRFSKNAGTARSLLAAYKEKINRL
jgi:hypothetical protein